jgi:ferredoxin-NADP reductase
MNPRIPVVVEAIEPCARDVVELRLRGHRDPVLPTWSPGAHIGLHLPNGLVREYSLLSDPLDCDGWTVAVYREPQSRGGSAYIHDQLQVGSVIEVDGPKNHFVLESARRYLLVAGGIGVTPMIAIATHLDRLGCEWTMLYAGRSAATMAYAGTLRDRHGDRMHLHADDEQGGPPNLARWLAGVGPEDLVYCCGPESLVQAVTEALPWPDALRVERFRAPQRPEATSHSFEVLLARSGQRITVRGSESLLDALDRCGIELPRSCTEGICGTCEVGVLEGEVDHRDFLLTAQERARHDVMMACVSRALTPTLTLDLPILTVADYER